MSDALTAAIARRRDDLITLTQDLIRMPTINPPGHRYGEICEYLDRRLHRSGFASEYIRAYGTPGDSEKYPRWNLIARRHGTRPGDCVHFNSHTDVVEVGRGWTRDPFGGDLDGDRIYGRGACDMKGGLAASVIAAEAFIEVHPDYAGSIEISGTADEETGGFGGVAYLAGQGHFTHVDHVLIPEPLGEDCICLGHRGVWWAEIETYGEIAHGSMPFLGDCAIRHLGAVLQEFEDKLYPALARKRTDMPVIPEGARKSTMNINSFHGGEPEPEGRFDGLPAPNVPDRARMVIDRRFLIEEDIRDVKREITEILDGLTQNRKNFRYDIREIQRVIPTMTDKTAPVAEATAAGIRATCGHAPRYVVSPGTYDQKHIARIGRLKNCIAYGPGILELAHRPDEYIEVSAMERSATVMGKVLERLLLARHAPATAPKPPTVRQ
ncbi:MAG: acetylornithine deacetylase/succinyl-diaminopimelate desuccinylase family protein [Rhodobacteraceae bacterium]|nr:acetylornithine deacetylase/succinyl-diaminopimelate desuccinylase family protein [Paracoccaceae bacterium]